MRKPAIKLRRLAKTLAAAACLAAISGCSVITVAGTVGGAAISVGATVVTTGVKVTGSVIEKGVELVTGGD
jgi:hypothetical protein